MKKSQTSEDDDFGDAELIFPSSELDDAFCALCRTEWNETEERDIRIFDEDFLNFSSLESSRSESCSSESNATFLFWAKFCDCCRRGRRRRGRCVLDRLLDRAKSPRKIGLWGASATAARIIGALRDPGSREN